MTPHNRALARDLVGVIERFVKGEMSISEVQSRLQAAMTLFDGEPSSPEQAVRAAEVDLEEIQFTMLLDEQRPAAVFRLDELLASLAEASTESD